MRRLRQHRLIVSDWVMSRDALNGQATCSHCLTSFDKMNGLQQHIIHGMCREFQPGAPSFRAPVTDTWKMIFQTGAIVEILTDLPERTRLSARCDCCRKKFSRAMDLRCHLQQQHSELWKLAQPLTKLLVFLVTKLHGCACDPEVKDLRTDHVCLPLLQVAMMYNRAASDFWFPGTMDRKTI